MTILPNIVDQTQVDFHCLAWQNMNKRWELITDLKGGTIGMREAAQRRMPQEEYESDKAYAARLVRSFLYEIYSDTIGKLQSKPFGRPVTVENLKKKPEWLDAMLRDVDKHKCAITQYAYDKFGYGIDFGMAHSIVDFPNETGTYGTRRTMEDVRRGKIRPVWRLVDPRACIGWRLAEDQQTGEEYVTELRVYTTEMVPDGLFGEVCQECVVHWKWDSVRKWTRTHKAGEQNKWVAGRLVPHSFGRVPIHTFYTNKKDTMVAYPPMEKLGWINNAHWISDSDGRNILRFARSGILFLSGITEEEYEDGVTVGPRAIVRTTRTDADMKYVEYQGGAIGHGQKDLEDLERRAEVLGLQPVLEQSKYATAQGRTYDEIRAHSTLKQWVISLEDCLRDMLVGSIKLMEPANKAAESLQVKIHYDHAGMGLTELLRNVIMLREANELTREAAAVLLKEYGIIAPDTDIDEFVKELLKEQEAKQAREDAQLKAKTQARSGAPSGARE